MTLDSARYFGSIDGRCWLNTAHQGPLPLPAVKAARRAIADKASPNRMAESSFGEVPDAMRAALAGLLDVPADEVVLGNSATYGLQLLVSGLGWRRGDEVVVDASGFPAELTPWLILERQGVRVHRVDTGGRGLDHDNVAPVMRPRTRLVVASWVNSFTGHVSDLSAVGALCAEQGATFVVNVTQGFGALPVALHDWAADAVTCAGWKWLLGPYASGLAWISPRLVARMRPTQAYWQVVMRTLGRSLDDLDGLDRLTLPEYGSHRWYDVFATANFQVFEPWRASVELLGALGMANVRAHDQLLVSAILDGLDRLGYDIISPREAQSRSAIVVFSTGDEALNRQIERRLAATGIDVAIRRGNLRASPHIHNTERDVARLLEALGRLSPRRQA